MSLSEQEAALTVLPDRDIAEILEYERASPETITGYVNRIYGEMRGEQEYRPVLHQFNRMGRAMLAAEFESSRSDGAITYPAFFMGQVLGLRGLEMATEQDVAGFVYKDINGSYLEAQNFATSFGDIPIDRSASDDERHARLAANLRKRGGNIAAYLSGEIDAVLDRNIISPYELELVTRWAAELAPSSPEVQEEFIDGYIFVRYRNRELGSISPKEKEAFGSLIDTLDQERTFEGDIVSLADFKKDFVEQFKERNDLFSDVDMTNGNQVKATVSTMNEVATDLFEVQFDVEMFDRLHIAGPGFFLYKRADGKPLENLQYMVLESGDHLRGVTIGTGAAVVPTEEVILPHVRAYSREDKKPKRIVIRERQREIGPVVKLTDVSVVDKNGNVTNMPIDMEIWVPLNYASTDPYKVSKTDAA